MLHVAANRETGADPEWLEIAAVAWLVRYIREVKGISLSDCQQAVTTLDALDQEEAALETSLRLPQV